MSMQMYVRGLGCMHSPMIAMTSCSHTCEHTILLLPGYYMCQGGNAAETAGGDIFESTCAGTITKT
jgi:hypothetical protein